LIKIVFLEVDYNKGVDIGVEGTVTKNLHAGLTNTASSLFGLAGQGTTPTSGITTMPGAGMYSIVGDDFSATLRAIEEVGNVQILSRPTILARNNQMASIQVGYQIPVPSSVTLSTFGAQTAIQWLSVGIILNVTPNITADGMVEMIVAPQISSVDPALGQAIGTTTNGVPITVPAIAIESANTVVVTPDGQTVVIGGLMKNNKSSTDSKIPLLGDIPGLGQLFHHKTSTITKQELIILLTPYVVRTPTDLARMSQDERGRLPMAPKAFTQKELNQYLESGNLRRCRRRTPAADCQSSPSTLNLTHDHRSQLGSLWDAGCHLGGAARLAGGGTHPRQSKQLHENLIERGRAKSSTCAKLMRAPGFSRGVINKERLEGALNALVDTNELRAVELLNKSDEVVASAGVPY
jgi:type II secretory pathway component GspD/PulD (secretin)